MTREEIRVIDRKSIKDFIIDNISFLSGSILDYGCGRQPYRDLFTDYTPYDKGDVFPTKQFDSIICTQVIQEVDSPDQMFKEIHSLLKGNCLLTYNTNWEEYGYPDRWRFTRVGMEELVQKHGFKVIKSELRYSIPFTDWSLPIGYGIIFSKT